MIVDNEYWRGYADGQEDGYVAGASVSPRWSWCDVGLLLLSCAVAYYLGFSER